MLLATLKNKMAQARRKCLHEHVESSISGARAVDRQGYDVKINIGGWSKFPILEGLITDIRAKRGNKIIIGKVLREEDLETGEKEFRKFINYAEKEENTSFRIYLTSEDGKPRLNKIL